MADQTTVRPVNALGGIAGNLVLSPTLAPIGPGIAASTVIWSGEMVGLDSSGNMVSASAAAAVTCVGIARATFDNRTTGTPPTSGLAGAISGTFLVGPYSCLGDGTITASTPFGTDVFVVDNQTVSTSDAGTGGAVRLRAGYFVTLDTNSNPVVQFGVASPSGRAFGGTGTSTRPNFARAVFITTTMASYTGTGTGVLTSGTNAALASQDGVTLAVGDVVLLQGGTLGSLAITAADTGPYVVTSLGSASTKWVLTRPDWFANGAVCPTGLHIDIGTEGTVFKGTTWSAWAAPGIIIGTTDPQFYPDRVTQRVTLASSTFNIINVPVLSTTNTALAISFCGANGGSLTGTVNYGTIVPPVSGYIGTASIVVDAIATAMAKNGTADTSFLNVTIINR